MGEREELDSVPDARIVDVFHGRGGRLALHTRTVWNQERGWGYMRLSSRGAVIVLQGRPIVVCSIFGLSMLVFGNILDSRKK